MNSLLAQIATRKEYFDSVRDRFVTQDPMAGRQLLIVLVLLAVGLVLVWVLYRLQKRQHEPARAKPVRLFIAAMLRLRLGVVECCRLWYLAHRLQMAHPAALLISASLFDKAVERYCQKQVGILPGTSTPAQFAAIRRRLFA